MGRRPTLFELSGLTPDELAQVLGSNPRAYMAVKGAVAEKHLEKYLQGLVDDGFIAAFRPGKGDFEKDFYVSLKSGESKVIECKNIQVISISTKQKIQAYLYFLITENIISTEDLREHIGLIGVQAAQLSCTDLPGKQNVPPILHQLERMKVQELKTLVGTFPSEIKDSGIVQYRFSASSLQFSSIFDIDSKTFLSQFNEDRLSIDFQRTRNSTIEEVEDDVSAKARRFYRVGELDIVAGCLFSRTTKWEFIFCNSNTLPLHSRFSGRYSNNLKIDPEKWRKHLMEVIAG